MKKLFLLILAIAIALYFIVDSRSFTSDFRSRSEQKFLPPLEKSSPPDFPKLGVFATPRPISDDELELDDDLDSDETSQYSSDGDQRKTKVPLKPTPKRISDDDSESEKQTPEVEEPYNIVTDALRDLERQTLDNNGMLGGVTSRSGGPIETAVPEATPSAVATPRFTRVTGQARGYTMLYMMQPEARRLVEKQVETLLEAQIGTVYIAALIDGTFSKNYDYVEDVLRRLSTDGRKVLLVLYLTNGATQRSWNTTPIIESPFVRISPAQFRSSIRFEPDIQRLFQRVVRESQQLFRFNLSLNPQNQNIAIVMLEDNLDGVSYNAMRALAQQDLRGLVEFYRNPCGCIGGSDESRQGGKIEEHAIDKFNLLQAGDGYSLDGVGFSYPEEGPSPNLNVDEVISLLDQSQTRGLRYFGLWRPDWQGIGPNNEKSHPRDRNYLLPPETGRAFEIELLRRGLPEIPQ